MGFEFETNSSGNGIIVKEATNQYSDGKIAKVYKTFIGDESARIENYKNFLVNFLRKRGCRRVLDVACGTGFDSIMLLEEGFEVVSTDGSDKMLKHAFEARWKRRKEPAFENWIIREANWLEVYEKVKDIVADGFDAVICFGSSFAHLLDSYGDQREQKQAIRSFEQCLKHGGVLMIDHRNYDQLLRGEAPKTSVYYDANHIPNVTTSVLEVKGKPALIIRDYTVVSDSKETTELRMKFYPHNVHNFRKMLLEVFGQNAKSEILGDFKQLDEVKDAAMYIHVVEKTK